MTALLVTTSGMGAFLVGWFLGYGVGRQQRTLATAPTLPDSLEDWTRDDLVNTLADLHDLKASGADMLTRLFVAVQLVEQELDRRDG